jgi:hypothetical protein
MRWLFVLALVACQNNNDDPANYVTGLRVLGIAANPPDVRAGQSTTVSALVVDSDGDPVDMVWSFCTAEAKNGQPVATDCVSDGAADSLAQIANGNPVTVTMPNVTPAQLGRVDASGGFYVPLVANLTAGSATLTAVYSLRLNLGLPPNQNPIVTDIATIVGSGPDGSIGDGGAATITPLDPANPLTVHRHDVLTLRAVFAPGSVETYDVYYGDPRTTPPRQTTEQLSVAWFSTAGLWARTSSGDEVADQTLTFDDVKNGPSPHLPASGSTVDIWAVARDERGGASWLHRTVVYQDP